MTRITLTRERGKELKFLTEKLCKTTNVDLVSVDHDLAFWSEDGREVLAFIQDTESYDTYLDKDGSDRLLHALNVQKYMEDTNNEFWKHSDMREDIVHELLVVCFTYTLKEVGKKTEGSNDFKHQAINNIETFKSIIVDTELLFEKACEALSIEPTTIEARTVHAFKQMLPLTHESYYQHPYIHWSDNEAFVHGVYKLHFS